MTELSLTKSYAKAANTWMPPEAPIDMPPQVLERPRRRRFVARWLPFLTFNA